MPDGRLSVILPNYNHAALLPRALGALAAQTRRADEILLLDDASSDDSVAVAESWRDRLPELRIIRQPRNVGVVENLRRGIDEATGEYLYMGASDDAARPALFARGVSALERHPQAAIAAGEAMLVGPAGEALGLRPVILPSRREAYLDPAATAALFRRAEHVIVSVAAIWRRPAMVAAGGLDPSLGAYVDSVLARELVLRHGFVFIPEVLGVWYVNPAGVSRSAGADPKAWLALVAKVRARMERQVGAPYPAWYPAVFERRSRFAGARVLVSEPQGGRIDVKAVAAMLDSDPAERAALGLAARLPGGAGKAVSLAWLALRHRPMSLAGVAAAWLDRKMRKRD